MKDFFISLVFLSIGTYAFTKLLIFVALRTGLIEVIDDATTLSAGAGLLPESCDAQQVVVASNGIVYLVATSGDGKRFELTLADPYATDIGFEIDIDAMKNPRARSEMLIFDAARDEGNGAHGPSSRWSGDRSADGLASTPFAFAA